MIKIKFLGTGSNGGIPQVDCRCKNCLVKNLISTRKRSSILFKCGKNKILLDCGPDFRQQLIDNNLRLQDLSGIAISHLHWDHCAGLFELSGGKKLAVPIIVHNKLKKDILSDNTFNFVFDNNFAVFSKRININFIPIKHAPNFNTFASIISFKNKRVIIATDIFKINKSFINEAKKCNLVIFDGTFLNESKHWHVSIKDSVEILKEINSKVVFTHINHSENVKDIENFIVKYGFRLAFDGMVIKV